MTTKPLAVHTHPLFYRHDTGVGHPENASRIDYALDGVERAGAAGVIDASTEIHPETDRLIARVHSSDYERELEHACGAGMRFFHSPDNPISSGTFVAARSAVGTALRAAEAIWSEGTTRRAFVVARPPGHHAERLTAMGFCFFNTIACVAERLRELPQVERVFIFDFDVHHGNGTQSLFVERDDVFYASMHRYPFYPGTGAKNEIGSGRGEGYTRNIPMAAGAGDAAYLRAVEDEIIPIIDEYKPQAILLSSGFDAHRLDPLGGMRVTESAYGEITRRMMEAADRHCQGRILSLLEGGYDPEGLAASVAEHVVALNE
jgi:acetoin utilization deacetylase AcuC-like enzyme